MAPCLPESAPRAESLLSLPCPRSASGLQTFVSARSLPYLPLDTRLAAGRFWQAPASERASGCNQEGAQGKVSSEPRGIRLPAREFGTTKTTRLVIPIDSEPDPSSPQAAEPHQSPATPRLFGMPSPYPIPLGDGTGPQKLLCESCDCDPLRSESASAERRR